MNAKVRKHKKNIHFLSNSKLTYETEPNRVSFNETEPNWNCTEPNCGFSSKPFRNQTEFQKSIPHIPTQFLLASLEKKYIPDFQMAFDCIFVDIFCSLLVNTVNIALLLAAMKLSFMDNWKNNWRVAIAIHNS